jgi:ferrous iron transport protein B
MDVFMHQIGLHGKSIIPFILGYGCSVPAVMATRILEFPQHRFIVPFWHLIPARRITIIFALAAFSWDRTPPFHLRLNLVVVAVSRKSSPFTTPMPAWARSEIPAYRSLPGQHLKKSWYRIGSSSSSPGPF